MYMVTFAYITFNVIKNIKYYLYANNRKQLKPCSSSAEFPQ